MSDLCAYCGPARPTSQCPECHDSVCSDCLGASGACVYCEDDPITEMCMACYGNGTVEGIICDRCDGKGTK